MPRSRKLDEFLRNMQTAGDRRMLHTSTTSQSSAGRKVDHNCVLPNISVDNYIKAILNAILTYPFLSSSMPWHSVGILRLWDDVSKMLTGGERIPYHRFLDALHLLRSLGYLEIVDGVVVNYKCIKMS